MPEFTTLDRIDPRGKNVLVRVDLNVPMKDGRVTDRTRIDRAAATLRELAERGGRVIVLSHFGRPKGRDVALSLQPLIQPLAEAIDRPVRFASDCIGPEAERVLREYEAKLGQAAKEAEALLGQARERAQRLLEENEQRLTAEAERIKAESTREIEQARRQAVQEIRTQTTELALMVAEKLVERSLTDADHKRFADEALEAVTRSQGKG